MKVAIRVDASQSIGIGHLQRCMALADALVHLGASVHVLTRNFDGVSCQLLKNSTLQITWLEKPSKSFFHARNQESCPLADWAGLDWEEDAAECISALADVNYDWVIVDHYALDALWHCNIVEHIRSKILIIDDLGDRKLNGDILLDQNLSSDYLKKYQGKLPSEEHKKIKFLTGPRYALLSKTYATKGNKYQFNEGVRSIGIFMGGGDIFSASSKVLGICREMAGFTGLIEIATVSTNPNLAELMESADKWPDTNILIDQPNLASFFSKHDLQIGAGGGASWERCSAGAPSIAVILSDNQNMVIPALEELGAVVSAKLADVNGIVSSNQESKMEVQLLDNVLVNLINDPSKRRHLHETALGIVDGRGAQRVALHMFIDQLQLRLARMEDAATLFAWRNDPVTRGVSTSTHSFDYDSHLQWMVSSLANDKRTLLVASVGSQDVGSIRFDKSIDNSATVSLYTDPKMLGLGVGSRMLALGERYMLENVNNTSSFVAQVVDNNQVSRQMFLRNGYAMQMNSFRKDACIDKI